MDNIKKAIMTIIVTLIVMVYTIVNYMNGKIDFLMFIVSMGIMGVPLLNMINLLVQELKKR